MSRHQGKGTLADLDHLKAEHAPQFKVASKTCKRGDKCVAIRCPQITRYLAESAGGLRFKDGFCTRKSCPRLLLAEYRRVFRQTYWRRKQAGWAGEWQEIVDGKRLQLEKALGR